MGGGTFSLITIEESHSHFLPPSIIASLTHVITESHFLFCAFSNTHTYMEELQYQAASTLRFSINS